MNSFEKLLNLRNRHRKEENELIYEILMQHLKPTTLEIKAARVKLFDEEMPEDLDGRRYIKIIERLRYRMKQWEDKEWGKLEIINKSRR